ncbi:MAG: T9SS type A sorting domain-containing protein [Bacteroidota bacterium]
MKHLYLRTILVFTLLLSGLSTTIAQPWTYDFGTGTGTANNSNSGSGNTSFFTSPPSGGGTYRVRIGTGAGSLVLSNPGTSLGTGSEAQLNATTGTSTNKFGIYDWTSPSAVAYLKFKLRTTSSGAGNINLSIGANTIASDNQGFTVHYNNALASLRINYSAGAIAAVQRRTSGTDNAISSSGIAKDQDQLVEVYLNNGASSTTYFTAGNTYTLNAQQWDLWVDGTKVSPANGWVKAGTLASGTNISGLAFFAESSAGNAANIYLDDFEYSNTLPVATGTPTKLAITNISPSSPTINTTFSVTVQSQDAGSLVANVAANTGISLSANGGFTLSGTTTGTINAGSNSITFNNVSVSSAGTGASITAARTSGDVLSDATSSSFNVLAAQPANQATAFTKTALSSSGITVGWTAATGTPDGYLVLRTTISGTTYPNTAPVDGTTYTLGNTLGNATIEYIGNAASAPISSLAAASQYSYAIYSYNGSGGALNYLTTSPLQGQAYTLSAEPASHAASFTNTVNSATSITLNFSAASTLSANGYILLRKASAFAPTDYPADGDSYTGTIGAATVVTTITDNSITTYTNNGVPADGNYNYLLVPFAWSSSIAFTRNYYTGGTIPTVSAVTPSGASDVTAVASSESATVSSIINTASISSHTDGVQVWQFTVRDGGATTDADALPTKITAITFTQSAGNAIDNFTTAIQGVALFNGTNPVPATVNITATQIQFSAMSLSISDNSSAVFSLRLSVKSNVNSGSSTGVNADGDDFGFTVNAANVITDVPANSSQFTSFSALSSANSQNFYAVAASKLVYTQQPSNSSTYANISPAVGVEATDAGGNRDLGYVSAITITATGASLQTSPASSNASSGLAAFSSIQFITPGTGVTLTAASGGLTSATSAAIDVALGAGSYTYRTLRSGDWKDVAGGSEVWERSTDGTNWTTVTSMPDVPSASAGAISILSGHTITIAASVSVDQLTIAGGAQLTVNSLQTLTIADGTGTDATINGTLLNNGGTIALSGTASFGAGSLFKVATGNGSDILSAGATYDAASTIEITGVVAQTSYTFPGKSIGNLTWNNTGQTANINTSASIGNLTINGNVTVKNTGSGSLRFTGSASLALVIAGNFEVQPGASLDVDNNASGTTTISIGGHFNMTGGTFQSSADQVDLTLTGSGKTFTQSSGTFTNTNLNWIIGAAASVALNNDLPLAASRLLTVNGTLNCGTNNITGAGGFTLAAAGTLGIGSIDGLTTGTTNGNIRVSGTRTYHAAAYFIYNNSNSSQVTGDGLAASANTIINNTNGVILSEVTNFSGSLTLQNGQFNAANKLTFLPASSLIYAGGSIINHTFPAVLNNYTPGVSTTLASDLEVTGTLNLGSSVLNIDTKTLTITGDVTRNSGTISSNGGSIVIAGPTLNESLFFDQATPGTTNSLASLTINRASSTITLGNAVNVTGTVTPTNGILASDSNLTLVSTASATARIAALGATANVSGVVNVQRYFIGGVVSQRGWRTMSSPVQSFTYNQFSDDLLISGPGGSANGFDAHGTNSSIRYHEESATRGWKNIAATSETLSAGKGMLVFFRGDRTQTSSLTDPTVVPNNLTADYSGVINKNTIPVALDYYNSGNAADDGFNFVGNPYPCEIIWNNITKTAGVDVNFWVVNPNTGNYVSQTGNVQIASGQGFFVQVNQSSESITFEESAKGNGNPTSYFKTSSTPFTIKMFADSIKHDVAWLDFSAHASRNFIFKEDARKMMNPGYNLSFVTPDNQLVQRNVSSTLGNASDTFVLQVSSANNAAYTLGFEELASVSPASNIYLVDRLMNTITDIRAVNRYSFQVSAASPASSGKRFLLIFEPNGNNLPVKMIRFQGAACKEKNEFMLEVAQEKNIMYYELLRSADGNQFEPVSTFKPEKSSLNNRYNCSDNNPLPQKTYYRIKATDFDGTGLFSRTIALASFVDEHQSVYLYPNPSADYISVVAKDFHCLTVKNSNGQVLFVSEQPENIQIKHLDKGIYFVEIVSEQGINTVKFIKK